MTSSVSVIFGTYNRLASLKRCVEAIREDLVGYDFVEIVVTDGGSTDGSREWLAAQRDVVLVALRHLGGAVEAFNYAYRVSRGEFIVTLNDDVKPVGGALHHGVEYLRERPELGQVALLWQRTRKSIPRIDYLGVDRPYANFGVVRRVAVDHVAEIQRGIWNPCYRTYGADCELSAWLHYLGYGVGAIQDPKLGYIEDYEIQDALRAGNAAYGRAHADGSLFWKRWSPRKDEMFAGSLPPLVTAQELNRLGGSNVDWTAILSKSARKGYSQYGEEGVIERLFASFGTTNKFLVDIGAHDGYTMSNTRLLLDQGWTGALFDCAHENQWVHREHVTAENVCDVLQARSVPVEFDFLSLDIDGVDWYVLRALLRGGYKPRIFVCEINSNVPAYPPVAVEYDPQFKFSDCDYFGASLGAFEVLAAAHGYSCIYIHEASNAFFVASELLPIPPQRSFSTRRSWGPDPLNRPWYELTATDTP